MHIFSSNYYINNKLQNFNLFVSFNFIIIVTARYPIMIPIKFMIISSISKLLPTIGCNISIDKVIKIAITNIFFLFMFLKTNGNIIPIGININILPISISRIQVPIESSPLIKYLNNYGTKLKLPENQPKLSPVEYPFFT